MQLHAEQSQLQNVGGDLGYNFFKRAADTKLLVSDGETAVIGGLTETTITKTKQLDPDPRRAAADRQPVLADATRRKRSRTC